MPESFVQMQVRLVLEKQCREYADLLKSKVPAGVGFTLFLFDLGADGNIAYVSTATRETMIGAIHEWLDHQDANHPAEGWETAARFMIDVAKAIGFEGEPEPTAILKACRELRAKEQTK